MKVDIHFFPLNIEELLLKEKTVVVVDVLRASTSITTAIYNGAKEVVPVTTVAEAGKIAANTGGSVVLGGERNGVKIEGFHIGNSPTEYTIEKVKNKTVVFSSTNGSVALAKTQNCRVFFNEWFRRVGKNEVCKIFSRGKFCQRFSCR